MQKGRAIGLAGTLVAVAVLVLVLAGSAVGALVVGAIAACAMFAAAREMRRERDASR